MKISEDSVVPIGKRLLLKVHKQETETSGGLILSEGDGYATPVLGVVLKVGDENSPYKEGDTILFRRYSVDTLKYQDEDGEKELFVLEESEVVAMVASK